MRKLAAAKLANEKPGQTLQATALVHEAYLRLVDVDQARQWDRRGHFFAANRRIEPKRLSTMVRGDLDWNVMKALEKDRTRRYATANEFVDDILHYLNHEPVHARPPRRSTNSESSPAGTRSCSGLLHWWLPLCW